MAASDAELLRETALGSREALATLYDRHSSIMLGVAVKMLRSRRDAEEIVHDVFLEAWSHAGDYDAERSSVKTWLLLRLRSRCLDLMRSAAWTRTAGFDSEDAQESVPPESSRSVDGSRAAELLRQLPEPQRDVLALAYFGDLSMSEIAEALSLPIGTVKSRAARGLAEIKDRMEETGAAT
jgi:RNA polymerase sigma-70 factor (ECF subfamily)